MNIRNIKAIFENLQGNWKLERTIEALNNNTRNYATGIASFTKSEKNALEYEENGILTLSENLKTFHFNRKYVYKLEEENIVIILNDGVSKGKIFQVLSFTNENNILIGTEHICRMDKHLGKYKFINSQRFEINYTIQGEKTSLNIYTSFYKIEKPT